MINDKTPLQFSTKKFSTYKTIFQDLLNKKLKISSKALFELLHFWTFSFKEMRTELSKCWAFVLGLKELSFSEVTNIWIFASFLSDAEDLNINYKM